MPIHTMTDYLPLFLTGLFGSAHCVGMCGPIVLAYSVNVHRAQRASFLAAGAIHLLYNFGRVMTYVSLGFAAGLLGAIAVQLGPWQRAVSITAGAMMVLFGLTNLRLVPVFRLDGASSGMMAAYRKGVSLLIRSPGLLSRLLLGVFNGFLPCGLVYAALLKAASTQSPLAGAASMAAFGSGTVAVMLLLGYLSTGLSERTRRIGERFAAALVILMGLSLILRGAGWSPTWLGGHGHGAM